MTTYEEMLMNQSEANSAFNASQAEINRDWQEYMSGTSHQREVNDLIAAGLNPVLSANSGSSWQSVANATADVSSAAGQAALAQTAMNNRAQLEMNKISAEATKAAAGATAAATMAAASMNSSATRYAAEKALESNEITQKNQNARTVIDSTAANAYGLISGASGQDTTSKQALEHAYEVLAGY